MAWVYDITRLLQTGPIPCMHFNIISVYSCLQFPLNHPTVLNWVVTLFAKLPVYLMQGHHGALAKACMG